MLQATEGIGRVLSDCGPTGRGRGGLAFASADEQVEVERVNVARAYVDCRQRHAALVTFVKGAVRR